MFEEDYIMRLIHEIVRVIIKLITGRDRAIATYGEYNVTKYACKYRSRKKKYKS